MRAVIVALVGAAIVACGSTTSPNDGGSGGDGSATCCPLGGGGACAGGGSRAKNPTCAMTCDCLKITGTATDSDGCAYDVYVSTYPNCGMVIDSGADAVQDAPGEGG